MMNLEYPKALKLGQRAYRQAVSRGEYPYLPALDEILDCAEVQTEIRLGLVEIPVDQIVGTKTAGRKNSFAVNFMPIMPDRSEFAVKWNHLYDYQIDCGVNDPILAYEFMNRFYVLEGNKRVSVFKYLNAPSIEGEVIRIVPKPNASLENRIYYEYMDFYRKTEINYLWFSKENSFSQLTQAVGKAPEEPWTLEERKDFKSIYTDFQRLFEEKGGEKLSITPGDAFLFYLSLYPYKDYEKKSLSEHRSELDRIWAEISLLNQDPVDALVLQPSEEAESSRPFAKFLKSTSVRTPKVAFIHDRPLEVSSWTYGHELGRAHLKEVFGEEIQTSSYTVQNFISQTESGLEETEEFQNKIAQTLEKAIQDGNQIIFTTHQKFLSASLKAALNHPELKFLNCSVNRPYNALRTYYGRMYEAKFLCGMAAGAMCENDKIAYLENAPILGSYANINAFALGARMTNPRAKIYLHWNSDHTTDFQTLLEKEKISLVSDNDLIRPENPNRRFGLYLKKEDDYLKLATPIWNWGKFYEKIIRDILQGNWNRTPDARDKRALNYWWGISGEIIDLIVSQNLPSGIRRLTELMKEEIYTEHFYPFSGNIVLQDGRLLGSNESSLSPEEIITMDWLAENVVGEALPLENLQ